MKTVKKKTYSRHLTFWGEHQRTMPVYYYSDISGNDSYFMLLPDWKRFPRKKLTTMKNIYDRLNPKLPF